MDEDDAECDAAGLCGLRYERRDTRGAADTRATNDAQAATAQFCAAAVRPKRPTRPTRTMFRRPWCRSARRCPRCRTLEHNFGAVHGADARGSTEVVVGQVRYG